jgi:hypothetical protein
MLALVLDLMLASLEGRIISRRLADWWRTTFAPPVHRFHMEAKVDDKRRAITIEERPTEWHLEITVPKAERK